MKIYLMRHGETDANRSKVLQGQLDRPLNDSGRQQAREAARELAGIVFDKIYSSPLSRAVETGELASGVGRENFILDDRIQEIGFGEAEGKPFSSLGDGFATFFSAPEKYRACNGAEDFESLIARVGNFLEEIKTEKDETVLILSHGAAIHAMLLYIGGYGIDQFWSVVVGNCGISEIEVRDGKYVVTRPCTVEDNYYGSAAAKDA